jgi:hypothetical protein
MATIGMTVSEGPAMRMHMEQLEKRVRLDAERDAAIAKEEMRQRRIRTLRAEADRLEGNARAARMESVLVDHPVDR